MNGKEMQKIGINRSVIEKVVGLADLAPPCKEEDVKSLRRYLAWLLICPVVQPTLRVLPPRSSPGSPSPA